MPDDDVRLSRGSRGADRHQDNGGCRGSCGHCRVHHDAQLAVIGVGLVRVQVGDLGYDQQGKQDKAHDRYRREDAVPGAAPTAEICLQCCQSMTLTVPILQKNVSIWTLIRSRGYVRHPFFAANGRRAGASKLCCHG